MAHRLRLSAPGQAWLGLSLLAGGGALLGWWLPAHPLDWQPAQALQQPWRAISAAWVHWSPQHLAANLAGTAVVAALGWVARLPLRATLAWALAWPATHLALLGWPALAHYGGLSGVLHAAVAVAAAWLLLRPVRAGQRWVGAGIAAGLLAKLLLEAPWGPLLRPLPAWDIAVAPLAHATGALAGLLAAALLLAWPQRQAAANPAPGPGPAA